MIEVIGFWASVTVITITPIWLLMHYLTRWILSIAKQNAPEIPRFLRNDYARFHWDWHLYPQWAHNLHYPFGGWFDQLGILLLGATSLIPFLLWGVGIFHPDETVIKVIAEVSEAISTMMGWTVVLVGFFGGGYFLVNKGTKLIGLVQLQEMKEKHNENR